LLGFEDPTIAADAEPPRDAAADAVVDTPTPAQLAQALLEEWSGCMSLANLSASGLAPAWANLAAGPQTCATCHSGGENGFIATTDAAAMFALLSQNRFYLLQFFTADLVEAEIVISTTTIDLAATAQPPHQRHPTFPTAHAGITALQDFHSATAARRDAGECDPPRLLN
jgi:hypothetical protein